MRSVGFTLILLVIVLYVFGIGFTQLLKGPALAQLMRARAVALLRDVARNTARQRASGRQIQRLPVQARCTVVLSDVELPSLLHAGVALSMQMLFLHCTLLDSISELWLDFP